MLQDTISKNKLIILCLLLVLFSHLKVQAVSRTDFQDLEQLRAFSASIFEAEVAELSSLEIYQSAIINDTDYIDKKIANYQVQSASCPDSLEKNAICQRLLLDIKAAIENIERNVEIFNSQLARIYNSKIFSTSPTYLKRPKMNSLKEKLEAELAKNQKYLEVLYHKQFETNYLQVFKDEKTSCLNNLALQLRALARKKLVPSTIAREQKELIKLFSLRDSIRFELEEIEASIFECGIATEKVKSILNKLRASEEAERQKDLEVYRAICEKNTKPSFRGKCWKDRPSIFDLNLPQAGGRL